MAGRRVVRPVGLSSYTDPSSGSMRAMRIPLILACVTNAARACLLRNGPGRAVPRPVTTPTGRCPLDQKAACCPGSQTGEQAAGRSLLSRVRGTVDPVQYANNSVVEGVRDAKKLRKNRAREWLSACAWNLLSVKSSGAGGPARLD